jgi:hypothetical protein
LLLLFIFAAVLGRKGDEPAAKDLMTAAEKLLPSQGPRVQGLLWHCRGLLAAERGAWEEARVALDKAAALVREHGGGAAQGENWLGRPATLRAFIDLLERMERPDEDFFRDLEQIQSEQPEEGRG